MITAGVVEFTDKFRACLTTSKCITKCCIVFPPDEAFYLKPTITGGVPYDGATLMTLHLNHIALVVLYSIAAVAGLVYAAVCLVFNLLFRKKK